MPPLRPSGFVDPGWEHGIAQDERKKKVKCKYCGKIVSGGIYRLKQHLARVSGEVTYCDKAPEEVYLKMRENLERCRSSRKPRPSEDNEQAYLNFHSNDDEEEEDFVYTAGKGKQLTDDTNLVINLTPLRSLGYVDPGWEHGVAQDERKKKVKCKYCEKIVSGGINRFKQHLARIPGEVAPCKNAPEEVYLKIKENMKWHRTGRRHKQPDSKEISAFYVHSDNEDEEDEQDEDATHVGKEKQIIGGKRLGTDLKNPCRGMHLSSSSGAISKRSRLNAIVLQTPRTQIPPSFKQKKEKTVFSKKSRKEVITAICKFFYHAGIPSHSANSPYFHRMLELVGQYGQGLIGPSSRLISGRFLQDEIMTIRNYLVEYKASWAITGCSIMADSWQDVQGRTVINFLVFCPHGIYFVSSFDATDIVEDATTLFKLLDRVVEEINEENVVQVITPNTPAYMAAGKMLEDKRRHLFWTPCASYCIDRMLEDFVKTKWVRECMEKGQKITKFIYNQFGLLSLMKKEFTRGQELLRPAITQHASSFATLQSLLDHRIGLKRMFQSDKWLQSRFSKLEEGKEVEKIILSATFWKKMHYVQKSVDPIVRVLQKSDSDGKLSMASIYNDMYRAKLTIRSIHGDDAQRYGPFWKVLDSHCNSLFQHPLYSAAYFLNPSYRYHPDFVAHPEVMRGLNECIVRLEQDNDRRISASLQISDFNSAKADFGTELAISTRTQLDPAAWWQQHGINCLELQRIAVRILSQTCSSFGCEHYWSVYDQIHSRRHNRLAQKRINDLIYVHYNLRLREHHLRRMLNDSISTDSVLIDALLEDWLVEKEKQTLQENEEILYNEMENGDAYENEFIECEDGTAEVQRRSFDMATLADVGCFDIIPAHAGAVSGDDDDDDGDDGDDENDNEADLNFLEDGLSG